MSATLADRVGALAAALDAGGRRLPADVVTGGRAVVARAGERAALSGEHTVVALAGSTGSGKSSLFNALVGADLAGTGVQRPTTSEALAAVRGAGAEPLLDWLGVRRRHDLDTPGSATTPGGLVLLDLPDHDSVVTEHRLRAEHLVARADLLVWVVDPQKYADAALHERYLRPLARHADVVVLVLNQADRLAPAEVDAVLADLGRLATEDGLGAARTLAVSARTGAGLDGLRALLADAVERRRAATQRWVAEVEGAAHRVLEACDADGDGPGGRGRRSVRGGARALAGGGSGGGPRAVSSGIRDGAVGTPGGARSGTRAGGTARGAPTGAEDALVDALAGAAGVPVVVEAVRAAAVRRATARTGWPPVRWLARFRPDPLRRLHLGDAAARRGSATATDVSATASVVRTSLPPAGPAARAAASSAVRGYLDAATAGVPDAWAIAARAGSTTDGLGDALDAAIAGTALLPERPARWTRAVGVVQWVLLAAALAGALWLAALAGLAYLRLPEPRTPEWGPLPVPTALLAGGLLAGVLLALLSSVLARVGAGRRARAARARLRAAVGVMARARVADPVAAVLADLATCVAEARRAAGATRR